MSRPPGRGRPGLQALLALAVVAVTACDLFVPEEPSAFYTPPDPLPAAPPGALLRFAPLPDDRPDGAVAYRILYLSTDVAGDPVAVSGYVVAPEDQSAEPRPVLAWAHGTTGIRPACGVSHTDDPYQQTPSADEMLAAGFVVVGTDYPGLGTPGVHPYLVGRVEAYAVLDAVRAARQLDVGAGARFVVWGASQGGHAALWTAQLAEEYAPELELVAAAASAPATDLKAILGSLYDAKAGGIFLAQMLHSWDEIYPDTELDSIVRSEHRKRFERMTRICFTSPGAFLTLGRVLTPREYLRVDFRTVEPWSRLLEQNTPSGEIRVPLLLTQGVDDDVVPPSVTEGERARRCESGEDVTLITLPGVGHDAREESAPFTIDWLGDRLREASREAAC